ncbi:hypothethical protein (plasmid) [Ralstonia solanacearum CMR15]|nr:hypothethical protein [Ralstonia solanacearum CMR15]
MSRAGRLQARPPAGPRVRPLQPSDSRQRTDRYRANNGRSLAWPCSSGSGHLQQLADAVTRTFERRRLIKQRTFVPSACSRLLWREMRRH